MDFVTHLFNTPADFDCITTYVKRLTKRVLIVSSKSSDTAKEVKEDFYGDVICLHGLPENIVSERGTRFTVRFWKLLLYYRSIKTKMATSKHQQTDEATDIINRMIGNYIRCYRALHQSDWEQLLPFDKFACNSANIFTLRMCPFELDMGWNPGPPLELLSNTREPCV